ncbi:MAG: DUF2207 domain-containing protein [Fretibacterium sp.]|nr:DUF2207 domain-containing protein [Fretibacterium sp.]
MRIFLRLRRAGILSFALSLLLCLAPAEASTSTTIEDISIHVALLDDGSAEIVQTWETNVSGKGSEFYIPQQNLGDMALYGFSVQEEGRSYIDEGWRWRTDRPREEKTGRFGIARTREGLELCWGQGAAGRHVYRVSWSFTNFVKAYDDYDAFNVRLVNSDMKPAPRRVRLTIEKPGRPFEQGEVHMWSFGFEGMISLSDGKVQVFSSRPLSSTNYVTVMLRFDKGIFQPSSVVEGSFERLKERAMKRAERGSAKSSYLGWLPDCWDEFLMLLPFLFFPFKFFSKRKGEQVGEHTTFQPLSKEVLRSLKEPTYWREIPFGGNLAAAYVGLQMVPGVKVEPRDLMGARFLRFLQQGNLEVVPAGEDLLLSGLSSLTSNSSLNPAPPTRSWWPWKKAGIRLRLIAEPGSEDPGEAVLFSIVRSAAGANEVLEERELLTWGEEHYSLFRAWQTAEEREGVRVFREQGASETTTTTSFWVRRWLFLGPRKPFEVETLTPEGERRLMELVGFRRYLQDFTLINERRVVELELWDDYLVFAALYGIAEQVAAEFLALYPDFADRSAVLRGGPGLAILRTADSFVESFTKPSYDPSSGGSSFSDGGDGSSGGGSGGGER